MPPPVPIPAHFPEVRVRRATYYHVGNGWSVRQVRPRPGAEPVWRVYWGYLPEGSVRPSGFANFIEGDATVEFPQFPQAVAWVLQRKNNDRE